VFQLFFWIEKDNTNIRNGGFGFNLTEGANPPIMRGDESPTKRKDVRKKISEANLGENHWAKGKTYEELFGTEKARKRKEESSEFMKNNNPMRNKEIKKKWEKIIKSNEYKENLKKANEREETKKRRSEAAKKRFETKKHPRYGNIKLSQEKCLNVIDLYIEKKSMIKVEKELKKIVSYETINRILNFKGSYKELKKEIGTEKVKKIEQIRTRFFAKKKGS